MTQSLFPSFTAGNSKSYQPSAGGLSKRELFAAFALQGILSNLDSAKWPTPKDAAKDALDYADALEKRLAKDSE